MEILKIRDMINELSKDNIVEFLSILSNLTKVYNNDFELEIMTRNFKENIINLSSNINIFIIIDNHKIIGTGTLIIEQKVIHNFGKVGHIEDVVIDKNVQGKGLGKKLINFLIDQSKINNCYKVVLSCSDDKVNFYKKCQPNNSKFKISNQISYYLKDI